MRRETVLKTIEERFKGPYGYIGNWDGREIYCPQVNGLMNLSLRALGYTEAARANTQASLNFPAYQHGLFSPIDLEGRVLDQSFNTCKNAVAALNLAAHGFRDEAARVLDNLKPLDGTPLYGRDKDDDTVITQSNLWVALAAAALGRDARPIMRSLEQRLDHGLFWSKDCRENAYAPRAFLDDQALAIMVYDVIGERDRAEELATRVLESPLGHYWSSLTPDGVGAVKSTYKNSLLAIAFHRIGYPTAQLREGLLKLYEDGLFRQTTRDATKVPDNSALALVALSPAAARSFLGEYRL